MKFFYTRSQEVVGTYIEMLKCNGGRSNSGKCLVISTILYTVSDIRCWNRERMATLWSLLTL